MLVSLHLRKKRQSLWQGYVFLEGHKKNPGQISAILDQICHIPEAGKLSRPENQRKRMKNPGPFSGRKKKNLGSFNFPGQHYKKIFYTGGRNYMGKCVNTFSFSQKDRSSYHNKNTRKYKSVYPIIYSRAYVNSNFRNGRFVRQEAPMLLPSKNQSSVNKTINNNFGNCTKLNERENSSSHNSRIVACTKHSSQGLILRELNEAMGIPDVARGEEGAVAQRRSDNNELEAEAEEEGEKIEGLNPYNHEKYKYMRNRDEKQAYVIASAVRNYGSRRNEEIVPDSKSRSNENEEGIREEKSLLSSQQMSSVAYTVGELRRKTTVTDRSTGAVSKHGSQNGLTVGSSKNSAVNNGGNMPILNGVTGSIDSACELNHSGRINTLANVVNYHKNGNLLKLKSNGEPVVMN